MKILICIACALASVLMGKVTVAQSAVPESIPLAVRDAEARNATKPVHAMKIILVGDSTTQVGSGWGGEFCARHVTSFAACIDMARGGRSTFSYRAESSWQLVLNEAQTPGFTRVYVLIQFGHNDQPGKPGRSTDLKTEFSDNLRRYVSEARNAGAVPVLVTPLTRRSFRNGQLLDDLQPWADATEAVAKELGVPLVDLHRTSMAAVQALGPVLSLELAQIPAPYALVEAARKGTTISAAKAATTETTFVPSSRPTVEFDYTHLGPKGAALFAAQITEGLWQSVPELRDVLLP